MTTLDHISLARSKEITDGLLCRLSTNVSIVSLDCQVSVCDNIQFIPYNTSVTLPELAVNGCFLRAHGSIKLAITPQDPRVRAGITAVQSILMVQVNCSLDGCVRVRAPGQNGLAPGHANVVVQLPCSIRDTLGECICNAVSESALTHVPSNIEALQM